MFIFILKQIDDVVHYMKRSCNEYQRVQDNDMQKRVKWQFEQITQEVSGTNIQRTVFKKHDFYEDLYKAYLDNRTPGATPIKKREGKLARKAGPSASESDDDDVKIDWEKRNELHGLVPGQRLISHKTANSMNNMLPSVRSAHEAAALTSAAEI